MYYIHGPSADEINFCGFSIFHRTIGITRCYKMAVFYSLLEKYLSRSEDRTLFVNPLKGRGVNWLHFAI